MLLSGLVLMLSSTIFWTCDDSYSFSVDHYSYLSINALLDCCRFGLNEWMLEIDKKITTAH